MNILKFRFDKMNHPFHKFPVTFLIVFFVLYPFGEAQAINRSTVSIEGFIGTWKGAGRVIVAWCEQKQISFDLKVHPDGSVSGKIGDAHIKHGTMRPNNLIYRWIGNREYIVDAELSGYLVEKEKIERESIRIFIDFENPFLIGGFHTSGSKFGGKEKMILSGTNVKLVRAAN
jgi:hypothetical protein